MMLWRRHVMTSPHFSEILHVVIHPQVLFQLPQLEGRLPLHVRQDVGLRGEVVDFADFF